MILDTSFVVDLLRGDDEAVRYYRLLEAERRQQKLAAITVLELYEGLARSRPSEAERRDVASVIDSKPVVPADAGIMRRAGRISGSLLADGLEIDREDCIIAATALREGDPIITRNVAHFERVEGVDVESY